MKDGVESGGGILGGVDRGGVGVWVGMKVVGGEGKLCRLEWMYWECG